MSIALQLLAGVALTVIAYRAGGWPGVLLLVVVLFVLELIHDVELYHQGSTADRRTAYRRWERWDG